MGRGYFEEIGRFGSHVYKNNDFSQFLREDNPSSLKSAIGFMFVFTLLQTPHLTQITTLFQRGDEGFRATSRLLDAAKTTGPVSADKKKIPAVNIAFDFSGSVFEWMSRPGEAHRGKRMGQAMQQLHRMANINVSEGMLCDMFFAFACADKY
jgi:hypothetical protein